MFIKNHDKIALTFKEESYTYDDLLKAVNYFKSKYKIKENEIVGIFSENRPEWMFSFLSIWENKGIVLPLDSLSTSSEISYICNDCKPSVIFHSNETEKTLKDALRNVKKKIKLINLDKLDNKYNNFESKEIDIEDKFETAAIIYTSGTTGSPKGVMLTYDNILANIESVSGEVPIYNDYDVIMILLPLHHAFPLIGTFLGTLYVGATAAMSPSLNGPDIMETLQKNKVSIMVGVPRLYDVIAKGIIDKINKSLIAKLLFNIASIINSRSFSKKIFKSVHQKFGGNLKYMVAGGAALDPKTAKVFDVLGFIIMEGYGMTETSPMMACPRPDALRIGSVGLPIINNEIKIIDGEICARGRNIMKGYYNRKKETDEVIYDGWLHSGDLGEFDKDGFLYVTGRKKEIIVLPSGKNINPVEIEEKLYSISDSIDEVAVFLKDGQLNAVIKPDLKKIEEKGILNLDEYFKWELIDKYNNQSASYKKIMKYHMTSNDIPRTRLSKIQRFKLVDFVEEKEEVRKKIKEPNFKEYKILKKYIENESGKKVFPTDHIEVDIGMDSLDKIGLMVFIQNTFGLNIDEKNLSTIKSIEALSEFIKDNATGEINDSELDWATILQTDTSNIKLPKSTFIHIFLKRILRFMFAFLYKIEVKGIENLPVSPFIFAPNHQSHLDAMILIFSLKNKELKKTYFFAKHKHFRQTWRSFIAKRTNIIVMDINKDVNESVLKLAQVLKTKNNLVIFPEGTRSKDLSLGIFKKSFAILSKELNVPIVPVAIKNSGKAFPANSKFIRPFKKIKMEYLIPVYPDGQDYNKISDRVKQEIENVL